jgi:hypothetical protein
VWLAGTLLSIAPVLLADVLQSNDVQPEPHELEHGEGFEHV